MIEPLQSFLNSVRVPLKTDVDLKKASYFKTGGVVPIWIYPESIEQIQTVIVYLTRFNYKYFIAGGTTNCLFLNDHNFQVFISLKRMKNIDIQLDDSMVDVEAGCALTTFARKMSHLGYSGFEGLIGIPGTIGGAVYMNAGAFGYETSDMLVHVDVLLPDGDILRLNKSDLQFAYRHSIFHSQKLGIIVGARFSIGERKDLCDINDRIAHFTSFRSRYLESGYPNLGSTFATDDIYREIACYHYGYGIILKLTRKIVYNRYMYKFFKINNNRVLNFVTCKYFGFSYKKSPFSDKTLNTVINNRESGLDAVLDYIDFIKQLTKGKLDLEIEIVGEREFL